MGGQTKSYTLEGNKVWGREPTEADGRAYHFKATADGGVNLYTGPGQNPVVRQVAPPQQTPRQDDGEDDKCNVQAPPNGGSTISTTP